MTTDRSPAELPRLADEIESRECTGITASWCPVHGTCSCPWDEDEYGRYRESLNDVSCPVHGLDSSHAVGLT